MGKYYGGCGIEIREDDGWVCPYYCRREDWEREHKGRCPCFVDLQIGTNVCLHAPYPYGCMNYENGK